MTEHGSNDPEAIEADIQRTRADLAATVDELSGRIEERKAQAKQGLVYAGAAVGAGLVVLIAVKLVRRARS